MCLNTNIKKSLWDKIKSLVQEENVYDTDAIFLIKLLSIYKKYHSAPENWFVVIFKKILR